LFPALSAGRADGNIWNQILRGPSHAQLRLSRVLYPSYILLALVFGVPILVPCVWDVGVLRQSYIDWF
jgi:hypothetical protein